jgi:hypothetical protein
MMELPHGQGNLLGHQNLRLLRSPCHRSVVGVRANARSSKQDLDQSSLANRDRVNWRRLEEAALRQLFSTAAELLGLAGRGFETQIRLWRGLQEQAQRSGDLALGGGFERLPSRVPD